VINPMKPMVMPETGAGSASLSPVLRASLNRGKIGATAKRLTTESAEDIALEEAYMNRGRTGIGRVLRNRKTPPPVVPPKTPTPPKGTSTVDPATPTPPKGTPIVDPKGKPTSPDVVPTPRFYDGKWWGPDGPIAQNKLVGGIGRFGAGQIWAMGDWNPFSEFAGTKGKGWKTRVGKGVGPGLFKMLLPFLAMQGVKLGVSVNSGEWDTDAKRLEYLKNQIIQDYGYSEDIAIELAATLDDNMLAVLGQSVGMAGDAIINDALIIAGFTLLGGIGGAAAGFFGGAGVGAIPGFMAGARVGYTGGRVVAGVSNVVNLAEMGLMASGNPNYNLPSWDDFSPWTHMNKSNPFIDTNENGVQDYGEIDNPEYNPAMAEGYGALGETLRGALGNSQEDAWKKIMAKYPDRFFDPTIAATETERYRRDWYGTNGNPPNPRIQEVVGLINEGYFVYKDRNGDWALDHDAVKVYLMETTRYKNFDERKGMIPFLFKYTDEDGKEQTMVPNTEWMKTIPNGIDQTIYNEIWNNG